MAFEALFPFSLLGGSIAIPLPLLKDLIGVRVGLILLWEEKPLGCLVVDEMRQL